MRHTYRHLWNVLIVLGVGLVGLHAQQPAASAEIRGTVRIVGGKRVPYAFVTAFPTDTTVPVERRMGQHVVANDKGEFTITGARGGKFKLCVSAPWEEILDPCEWSISARVLDVPDGASAADVDLEVPKGRTLRIHVNDPDRVVPTPVRANTGKFIQLGVRSRDGGFHKARLVSTDRLGHNYELVVPPDMEFALVVDTYNLEVRDETGKRASGHERGEQIKSDSATLAKTLQFSVRAAGQ